MNSHSRGATTALTAGKRESMFLGRLVRGWRA